MKIIETLLLYICFRMTWIVNAKVSKDDTVVKHDEKEENIYLNHANGPKNILFFHHYGSLSHLHFIRPLAEELARRGHNVTFVQFAASEFRHENFTEILVENRFVRIYDNKK